MRHLANTILWPPGLAAMGLILAMAPAHARKATITVAGAGAGTVTIAVPKGQTLGVTVKNNQGGQSDSGNIDAATGTFTATGVQDNLTDTYTVTIGGETFKDVNGGQTSYTSQEEKAARPGLHSFLYDTNGDASGFGNSALEFYDDPTGAGFIQFDLINSSPNPLLLSGLQLDDNLNQTFFTQALFDSPSAIASGVLFEDYIALTGDFTLPPGGDMLFIEPIAGTDEYGLLTGVVSAGLPNGSFGPPTDFALGAAEVPEPATLLLVGFGVAGLGYVRRRRPCVTPM